MLLPLHVQQAIKLKNPALNVGNSCQAFANTYDSLVGPQTAIQNFNDLLISSGKVINYFYGNISWSMWNPNVSGTCKMEAKCANDIANTAATRSYAFFIIRSSITLNEGWNGVQSDVLLTELNFYPPHMVAAISGYLIPVS